MRRGAGFLGIFGLALLAAPSWAALPASVQPPDRIDVRAHGESIAEVLDRIARQTGMKITYEGGAPRARIIRQVAGVTPAQAVVGVLEGQGLSYFMELDPTSTQVRTLLVVNGTGKGTRTASNVGPRRPGAAPPAPTADDPENGDDQDNIEPAPEEAPPDQQPQGPRQFRNSESLNQVEDEREPAPPPGAAEPAPVSPMPAPNLGGIPGAFTNLTPAPATPAPAIPAPGAPNTGAEHRRPPSPPGGVQ